MKADYTPKGLIRRIQNTKSEEHFAACKKKWDTLAKPLDGLGTFEELVARIGGIQHTAAPSIQKRTLLIFLSDNGIVEEGVSQCGSEVTHSVAEAMSRRNSTACVMAEKAGIPVCPVDIGMIGTKLPNIRDFRIREGSRNFAKEPAMTMEETLLAIRAGATTAEDMAKEGNKLLLLGEMGIGNTSTSTAVGCAILRLDPAEVMGRGAGLSDTKFHHKCSVIRGALRQYHFLQETGNGNSKEKLQLTAAPPAKEPSQDNGPAPSEEEILQILKNLGGYDIAGMVGAILMAAGQHIPVVLDGLITLTAALIAEKLCPKVREILIPSHHPREPLGQRILEELGLRAVIHGQMALGEGTGAILLIPMLDVCMEYYNNGTRFDGLGIEAYQRFDEE